MTSMRNPRLGIGDLLVSGNLVVYWHRGLLILGLVVLFPLNHRIFAVLNYFNCVSSDPEKAMAPYSSSLAWKIPWMKESGRLQSMRSLRVGHD